MTDPIFLCDDNFNLVHFMRELAEKLPERRVQLLTYAAAVDSALDDGDGHRFKLAHERAVKLYRSLVSE